MQNVLHVNFSHRSSADSGSRPVDRGIHMPTRELKLHIGLLSVMLDLPKDHPMGVSGRRPRKAMGQRLQLLRRELALRDARRELGRPMSSGARAQGGNALNNRHARAA